MMKRMNDEEFNSYVEAILSNPKTSDDDKQELYYLVKERQEHKKYNSLEYFEPHPWQEEFINKSAKHRYRFLSSANRIGKSFAISYQYAMLLTGKYPDWYKGKRFNHPVDLWVVGMTTQQVESVLQVLYTGLTSVKGDLASNPNWGTGCIPRDDLIISTAKRDGSRLESISVKHYNKFGEYDGDSTIGFKATSQGIEGLAGATLHAIHLDETPANHALTLYTELLQRTRTTRGLVTITATPDHGKSDLISKFEESKSPQEYMQIVSMYDSPLFTDEEVEQAKLEIPEYLHPAKIYGRPEVSSGAIFPFVFDNMVCDPFSIPDSYKHVCGVDIGWTDPTCATFIAMSPERIFYVYDVYSKAEDVPAVHAAAIKSRGADIPVILPADAHKSATTSGETAYRLYRDLLPDQVEYDTFYNYKEFNGAKNNKRLDGFDLMRVLFREDRVRFFSNLPPIVLQQLKNYRVKDGKYPERNDDYVDSLRYALLSCENRGKPRNQQNNYINFNDRNDWNPYNPFE